MKRTVYDLPTRIFHWMFASLFLIAFTISNTVDVESKWFSYHMLAGIILTFVVALRVIWGIVGTKHAKFSGFALNPKELLGYLKGVLTGDLRRWAGHNPASSWAAVTMMMLAIGLGVTGYLMSTRAETELIEDIHDLLSDIFIITVILHVCGIILHTIRHKELIGLSMVDGSKDNIDDSDVIATPKTAIGVLFLGLVVSFGIYLLQNYNSQSQTLNLFGSTLQLGENEGGESQDDD